MKSIKTTTDPVKLKVKTFEAAPDDFDPSSASKTTLMRHGIAPKPDKEKEPKLFAAWDKVYSKKLKHIVPEFVENKTKRHRPTQHPKILKNGTSTSTNWSGMAVFPAAGDKIKWLIGNWIVPDPNQPSSLPTGQWYYSSAWIGIDGWGSSDVCQAGTDADVLVQNGITHKQVSAWWEWFPDYSVTINNFPVSSGDYMTCLICSTGANTATIYLTNVSTGIHTSFQITAPSGVTLKGNCAEWIVEAPTVNGGQSALANYGATFFDECYAWTQNNVKIEAGSGTPINMVNSTNQVISQTAVEGAEIFKDSFV